MTQETQTMPENASPNDLRDALDRANKRANAAESLVKPLVLSQAGFPVGTAEHTALLKYYDGDLSSVDDIHAFADAEFGYKPTKAEPTTPTDPPTPAVTPATPDGLQTQQKRADLIAGGGESLVHENPDEIRDLQARAFKAEQEGDLMAAISLKNQAEQLRRNKAKGI